MNEQTRHIVRQLRSRIEATRRTLYRQELLTAGLKTFSVIGLSGTLIIFIESLAEFDSSVRTALFYLHILLSTVAGVVLMGKPLLRFFGILPPHSDREVARMIGAKFEKVADRLENMLDLSDMVTKGDFSGSPELIEVALEHFGRSTAGINFSGMVSFASLQQMARNIGTVAATVTALAVIPGTPFHDAAERMMRHDEEFEPPTAFTIIVRPGNADVVKGESVAVEAVLRSNDSGVVLPDELTLSYAEEGVETSAFVQIRRDSSGSFRYLFPPLKQSVEYRLSAGGIESDRYAITVTDRPFIRSLTMTLVPPPYTKLKRETLEENIGDVLVLPGTTILWKIVPSKEIAAGAIVFKDGSDIPLKKTGDYYTANFSAMFPTGYYVEVEDQKGNTNVNIIEYSIDMLTDEYPSVSILSPGKNIDVTEAMNLPLEIEVADDFGISGMSLMFRLVQSKYSALEKEFGAILPFDTLDTKKDILDYPWDLSLLGLVPEDVIEYYVEVQDNDVINGPKTAKTQSYLIRLPSLEEVFADAEKTHETVSSSLEESLKDAEMLRKELKELADDMKRNQQMDWQKQKKAEEVLNKYEEIRKKLEDAGKAIDEMTQTLQRNNTLSPETMEKYMELQRTLNEMNSPEFQKAMQRLQQAMQNVSPEQMREAMQQAQFNEEQFRQSIERTMKLLKRIQIEQKVDELIKRSEQMKTAQQEVNRQTENLKQNDAKKAAELSRQQEEVSKQLNDMQKELKDLQRSMDEFPKEMPREKMEEAQRAANDQEMTSAMKNSAQQLRSLQMEQAMTSQQQASSGIDDLQQQLSEMQEQLLNNQMNQTMGALRKAMQDLLQLSQQQEQLKNNSRTMDPNSPQFREMAQRQQNLQGDLSNVANALSELSQQSFAVTPEMGKEIGRAMGHMQQSMSAMEQRNGPMASAQQGEAMAALNKAATQMQGAMQQLQQQGGQGGGSLMQQLRGMAMQQQQINAQTQQIGEAEGMTQQQMQEIGRIARQQEAVRKSLEQLQREAQSAPEKERVMGDLNSIADEMKEVVRQLQQQEVNPNTLQQQERILSRLLQAQRSMRERDYEEKRTATAGTAPPRRSPAELSAQSPVSRLQQDLRRAQEAGYSKEYLELIRRYYESLEQRPQ